MDDLNNLNYSLAICYVNQRVKLIRASYETEQQNPRRQLTLFKTDLDVRVGDLVVVKTDTRHYRTVVRVEEINVPVDPEIDGTVDWVVCAVDERQYAHNLNVESQGIAALKKSAADRKAEAIRNAMIGAFPEIKELPIYDVGEKVEREDG